MTYKVESGIKPKNNWGAKPTPVRYPYADMSIMDSFFVECGPRMEDYIKESNKCRNDAEKFSRLNNRPLFRITIRREEGGFRVWREQ